eukprot:TRINITY_DN65443_c0_g1_i1.p1 TRINITY_DN65443_c0_g1~~TRINITY_DN65443_c0_g1_i1.p1  ORF type:complete len:417 (-),score=94.17 TRINITY_DN65443_c0_g1_i1:51-1301(-)
MAPRVPIAPTCLFDNLIGLYLCLPPLSLRRRSGQYMASALEQIQQAESFKGEGNRHHGAGDWKRALGAYHKVFCYLNGLQPPPPELRAGGSSSSTAKPDAGYSAGQSTTQIPKEKVDDVQKLKQTTRLNMAACYLKLEENQKCVDACNKALEQGECVKAYFRRAQAQAELRNFSGALGDLERAKTLAPDDSAVTNEIRKVRQAMQGGNRQEKQQAARMLAGAKDERSKDTPIEESAQEASAAVVEEVTEDQTLPAPSSDVTPSRHEETVTTEVKSEAAPDKEAAAEPQGRVVQPVNTSSQDEARKPDMALRTLAYSWQQSDEDCKVYVSFDQCDELAKGVEESQVEVEFGEWSCLLVIRDTAPGKPPLGLRLGDFHKRLAPERCRCTVRSSRITLKLVKAAKEHWWNLLQSAPSGG